MADLEPGPEGLVLGDPLVEAAYDVDQRLQPRAAHGLDVPEEPRVVEGRPHLEEGEAAP